MSDKLAALRREQLRREIIDPYDAFARGESAVDDLLIVTRKLLLRKINSLEFELAFKDKGTAQTAEDFTQDALLAVSEHLRLGKFEGNGANFYSFTNPVSYAVWTEALIIRDPISGGDYFVCHPTVYHQLVAQIANGVLS